jgi:hypothetical protein
MITPVVSYSRPRFTPKELPGLILWLHARRLSTVDAVVLSPNDLSTTDWTPLNLSSRTATTIQETNDAALTTHRVRQIPPNSQINHTLHYRMDIPLVGGNGRYVGIVANDGFTSALIIDTQPPGSFISVPSGYSNVSYTSGVLEFDVLSSFATGLWICTSNGSTTHYQGNGTRTAQIGPGTGGHDAIEVTQQLVSTWYDLSGNGNNFTQSTPANRVGLRKDLYGGKWVTQGGDATDNIAHATSVSLGTEATVFLVMKNGSIANHYLTNDSALTNGIIANFIPGRVEWFNGGGTDRYTFANSPIGLHIASVRQKNGVRLQGWWDGNTVFGPVVPNAALTNIKAIHGRSNNTNGGNADIPEVIVYNRALADQEHSLVVRYLGRQYGIAVP